MPARDLFPRRAMKLALKGNLDELIVLNWRINYDCPARTQFIASTAARIVGSSPGGSTSTPGGAVELASRLACTLEEWGCAPWELHFTRKREIINYLDQLANPEDAA